jgi:hypothetical protein
MTRLAKLACPLAILVALSFTSAPAKAQFGGMDESQMQQFAPMLEMMKQKMGKRRFGQLMQTMGPMMAQMEGQGGFGTSSLGSMDMGQMIGMIGSMKGLIGGGRKARRHRG